MPGATSTGNGKSKGSVVPEPVRDKADAALDQLLNKRQSR
jgi:hypothetical protein